jgi:hypothetical protein
LPADQDARARAGSFGRRFASSRRTSSRAASADGYGLTPWVTLIGEYVHTKAEAQAINEATSNALAAGAILFF